MSAPPELYDSLAPEDGGDSYPKQDSESTRYRRRSRSRSPPRRRSDQARSRSPAPRRERSRSPRRDSRSRSPRRDRSRSKDRMDMDQDSKPDPSGPRSARQASPSFDPAKRAAAREVAATEAAKKSKKDCRVYVGNLSFAVKWNDLKDFMRDAGTVVFSEIMMLPNGMSKGCGVVEFAEPEEAQKAIRELSDKTLLGRPLFIREDREDDARYGSAAVSGRAGYMGPGAFAGAGGPGFQGGFQGQGFQGGYQGRGGFQGGYQGGRGGYQGGGGFQGAAPAPPGQGRHLTVSGLPFNVGWQDLKDLFRAAGSIIRADVQTLPDGSPKGTGSIVYETSADAQNAIAMYNGFEFQGNILEVREDRAAPGAGGGGRGGFGGGYQGRGGFQPRGGFGGGYGGHQGFAGGRPFTQDMYAGFSGEGAGGPGGFGGHGGGFGGRGGFGGGGRGGFPGGFNSAYMGSHPGVAIAPSTQIFVKNLPWSTSNEDLIELFQTTGKVEEAEVLFDNGRSKGAGVVQFASIEEAETAIAKFQTYNYGGRPLALEFNGRFKQFGERAAVKDE